ncbi:MAG: hypothetical protein J6P57_10200 [Lachnospiraceae bacterium]|nr:hypothetical protein [Lachnospiraceae bacterium]
MADNNKELETVLNILKNWAFELNRCAGKNEDEAKSFWDRLSRDNAVLREFAYYYDNRDFLCELKIGRYTIADILVWQMDHFRAHMDRSDSANRYDKDKLLLSTFTTLLDMHDNPESIMKEFEEETGIDISGGWYTH